MDVLAVCGGEFNGTGEKEKLAPGAPERKLVKHDPVRIRGSAGPFPGGQITFNDAAEIVDFEGMF